MKITDRPGYKLAKFILSQKGRFTLDDVLEGMKKEGVFYDRKRLKKKLEKMRDNGIIVELSGGYEKDLKYFM